MKDYEPTSLADSDQDIHDLKTRVKTLEKKMHRLLTAIQVHSKCKLNIDPTSVRSIYEALHDVVDEIKEVGNGANR